MPINSIAAPTTVHAKTVELCKLVLRMTTQAGSGHPSSALSLAHIVVELLYREMDYSPANPWDPRSDRLVLSEGHAVPIVYAAYADLGGVVGTPDAPRRLTVDDLMALRRLDSVLDGHPNPAEGFPFFDAATGSLGQGLSVGAGLGLAARMDGSPRRVFVLVGDGESREGQIWEAMDFIAERDLVNVCVVFNCNGHGQAGSVSDQQSPEMLKAKATAFGWEAVTINGHDVPQVSSMLSRAGKGDRPLAIVARTVKGWGAEILRNGNWHGKPLSAADLSRGLAQLDETLASIDPESDMELPVRDRVSAVGATDTRPSGAATRARSSSRSSSAEKKRPSFPSFTEALARVNLSAALTSRRMATRQAYGVGLVALGDINPNVISLDADVSNSTYAQLFAAQHPDRFVECRIAEQNMLSTAVGMSAVGKIPFVSSFAKFIARACDQIDMAAITRANVKIVGSHSGVSLAADGPSQMSLSDMAYFRSMTHVDDGRGGVACRVFHPADPICAYRCVEMMAGVDGLCYLRTHRPEAPFLYALDETFTLGGCKQLRMGRHLTLVASGYIVHTVLAAAERLASEGVTCNVFDCYTLPLDAAPILDAARASGGTILTIEDNYGGGFYAELAEAAGTLAPHGQPPVRVRGLTCRRIPKSALTADEVFAYVGVGVEDILRAARECL